MKRFSKILPVIAFAGFIHVVNAQVYDSNSVSRVEAIAVASQLKTGMREKKADQLLAKHGLTNWVGIANTPVWDKSYFLNDGTSLVLEYLPRGVATKGFMGLNGSLLGASIQSNGVDFLIVRFSNNSYAVIYQPSEQEIAQKIPGTWVLNDDEVSGAPVMITVTFRPDGTFESSRNFTDPSKDSPANQPCHETWTVRGRGYFTVTRSHLLPGSNFQMFFIDQLDEHKMVCHNLDVGDDLVFRR